MNRIGLIAALTIGVVVGVVFAFAPALDLRIAGLSFDPSQHLFGVNAQRWVQDTRAAARLVIALLVAPAFLAVLGKLILPRRPMLIEGRAALFLIATLALGPGVLTNLVLKDHWGRSRPIDVQQFGGTDRFTPWCDPRGECPDNCSFVAGEPSGAFWTLAPAALAPPQWRVIAYGAALAFGTGIGALRIAGGAHFFTDVVFAGVLMYLVVWLMHGLIYRWRATRIGEAAIERALTEAGDALAALARRLTGRNGEGP
jgi:membrane-associated PAP2 superfamily phosphatase